MQSLCFPDSSLQSESEIVEITPIQQDLRPIKPIDPEIKLSSSLEDLMNHVDTTQKHPNDTNYLLTTSLMALVVRQNLGSTLSEIKAALDQARQEYNKLSKRLSSRGNSPDTLHENNLKNDPLPGEIKVMEETIKTLERALEKAEQEHQDVIALGENLKITQDHVQQIQVSIRELLEKMETVEQSLAKDCSIDEVKIKVLVRFSAF